MCKVARVYSNHLLVPLQSLSSKSRNGYLNHRRRFFRYPYITRGATIQTIYDEFPTIAAQLLGLNRLYPS